MSAAEAREVAWREHRDARGGRRGRAVRRHSFEAGWAAAVDALLTEMHIAAHIADDPARYAEALDAFGRIAARFEDPARTPGWCAS